MFDSDTPGAHQEGPTWSTTVILLLGMAVSGLGVAALIGWLVDLPFLAAFDPNTVPMAPSTALLFIAHGVALGLRARLVLSPRVYRAVAAVDGVAALVALTLLACSSVGIRSPLEHLGMDIAGQVRGTPIGHMSPVTAACFLLASVSAVGSLSRFAAHSAGRLIAVASASLLLGTSSVFLLAYLYGRPLLYRGGLIPPALNTTAAFAMLGLGLLMAIGRRGVTSEALHERTRASVWFLVVFILLAAGMITASHYYYQDYEKHRRVEMERELSAIADLKVSEITHWRKERLGDGMVLFDNDAFSVLVQRCIETPQDVPSCERLRSWLRHFKDSYHYDRVFFLDATGVERVAAPATPASATPGLRSMVSESLRSRQVTFLDFHRDAPDLPIHLSILVPIYAVTESDRALGVLVLRIDPDVDLYPIIRRWPTPSQTAETVILRRDGDDALFLNELRFQKGTALALREPLSSDHLPTARAVRGDQGIFSGVDCRGVEVLAALRSVPGSPWFLVARMNAAEVYAPLTERLWLMVLLVMTLVLGSGAALGLVWRQQNTHFYREKYQVELALAREQERYSDLVANLQDVVFSLDLGGHFQYVSPAIERVYGYRQEEMVGRHFSAFVHPEDLPKLAEVVARILGGSAEPHEFRAYDKSGRIRHLRATGRVRMERGYPIGLDGVIIDFTDLWNAEEQLRVSQRLEAVGRLAGGVAHDFNNLLSVILSYAGFAADALRESDPVRADIVEIQTAGQRAATLTRQLLAFSRKQVLDPQALNLNEVVAGIESMLRRLLGEDVDIEVHLAQDIDSVMADVGQIEQVIMNLAVNARDAMPQGGKLTIETFNIELDGAYAAQHIATKPGRYVLLSVTDTGAGMDAEIRQHIFEPFFTTKEKGKGSGLGLATVYGIVKQSGGNIWVYSEPGCGTTFKIYLPRVDALATDVRRISTSVLATGDETVLIVEDEEAVRRAAERMLRSAGYVVLTAGSGIDALVLCQDGHKTIDLLLTDVVMPQMSGRDLAEKAVKLRPGLKVLYMSGYTDNAIVHHGVLDPGMHFIGKPFATAALTRKVREVLDDD